MTMPVRRIAAITVVAVITLVSVMAFFSIGGEADTDAPKKEDYTDIVNVNDPGQLASIENMKLYEIGCDIELASAISIPSGVSAWIDLNGHTITAGFNGDLISVSDGGTLSFDSESPDGTLCHKTDSEGKVANTGRAVNSSGKLYIYGITITNNSTTTDGAAAYIGSGTFEISGSVIENNSAQNGGAVYAMAGTVGIYNCTIDSNTSTKDGGGCYFNNGSKPTMEGCTVSGNRSSSNGGGIANNTPNALFKDCTITGNTSGNNGGGILNWTSGRQLTIDGCTISDNSAKNNGGGMYSQSSVAIILSNQENITISSNSSNNGGGIYWSSSAMELSGIKVHDNTAATHGGGIYCSSAATIGGNTEIKDNTVTKNHGGGVYCSSDLSMNDGMISGNTCGGNGGGIYCSKTFTLNGGSIKGNTATTDGGGVYCTTAFVSGGTIGGTYNDLVDQVTHLIKEYATIIKEDEEGPPVETVVPVDPDIKTKTVTEKFMAVSGEYNTCKRDGAGICVNGKLTISGGTISGNATDFRQTNEGVGGGGAYCKSLEMTGGTICGNQHYRAGGGIYCTGEALFEGGSISGNISYDAGGVWCGFMTYRGTIKVNSNMATLGGGIYSDVGYDKRFVMESGEICYNRAQSLAGGLFQRGCLTIQGGTISYNQAGLVGGGIVNYQSDKMQGTLCITGGTISNNSIVGTTHVKYAESGSRGGAGLYVSFDFEMSGGTISGNTIKEDGANVKVNDCDGYSIMIKGNSIFKGGKVSDITDDESYTGSFKGIYVTGNMKVVQCDLDSKAFISKTGYLYVAHEADFPRSSVISDDPSSAPHHLVILHYSQAADGYAYVLVPNAAIGNVYYNDILDYDFLAPLRPGPTWYDGDIYTGGTYDKVGGPGIDVYISAGTKGAGDKWDVQHIYCDLRIIYDLNDGSDPYADGSVSFDNGVMYCTVSKVSPSREGYVFVCWSYTDCGETRYCAQGAVVRGLGDTPVTLTAVWAKETYHGSFRI